MNILCYILISLCCLQLSGEYSKVSLFSVNSDSSTPFSRVFKEVHSLKFAVTTLPRLRVPLVLKGGADAKVSKRVVGCVPVYVINIIPMPATKEYNTEDSMNVRVFFSPTTLKNELQVTSSFLTWFQPSPLPVSYMSSRVPLLPWVAPDITFFSYSVDAFPTRNVINGIHALNNKPISRFRQT